MGEDPIGVNPSGTQNNGGTGGGEPLKTDPPSQGSSQTPPEPKPNIGENAYEKGHRVGASDTIKALTKKFGGLINFSNPDEDIEKLKSLLNPEPTQPGKEPTQDGQANDLLKEVQRRLKESDAALKKAEEEKEIIRKEERLKYEIRNEVGKFNPYEIEEEVEKFFRYHIFDEGKDGLIIREKATGKPLMDGGDFLDIENAVKAWTNKRLFAYKSLSRGGAGVSGESSLQNLDMDKIKAGDHAYIQANRAEIKKQLGW